MPRDVRERVFDPAFADLVYTWVTDPSPRRVPFGVRAIGTYFGCFPAAIPGLFVQKGRLTRLGRASVWTVTILGALSVLVASLARSGLYASAP